MRQFRGLAVLVIALAALGAALLATRAETPPVTIVSPSPTATRTAIATPTTPPPSATPSPSPTPSPTPAPSPTPSKTFLVQLKVEGYSAPATVTATTMPIATGTTRFVLTLAYAAPPPSHAVPAFTVDPAADGTLSVTVPGGTPASLRFSVPGFPLWRAMVVFDPTRIEIDAGAPPGGVSDDGNTAVYAPVRGAQVGRTFHLSGAVRAFEATYLWRVVDTNGAVVAAAPATASIGTSPLWGAAETDVTLPASVSGNVTLEVYQVSPKDGSQISIVAVPLVVRP
ncbi:MAG: Gmad2 immunoglobulin-like domain-containing protein [Chloroflexota bacterium]|nr:Gmad2 immunoglobulin-like domain-containing protein [Chloroflexota bacterium]